MKLTLGRLVLVVIAAGIVAGVIVSLRPNPVPVDATVVARGPLQVTVDEDGKTRVRDRYVVSAPLGGKLRRIELRVGAEVRAGDTVLATIEPTDPALLDRRDLAISQARVKAAESAVSQAESKLREASAELDLARAELQRIQNLQASGATTQRELDAANNAYRIKTEAYASAEFGAQIARYELEQAQSALIHVQTDQPSAETVRFEVRSPITGRVLKLFQESAAVVQAGTPLLEVGDPTDLEIVVDVLSTDAVKILPAAPVIIDQWGGEYPLHGHVDVVEPSGFTKISALGVEEQRVNVIVRLDDPLQRRPTLADGFHVEARIVVWEGDDVVKIPTSALFRDGTRWAVFTLHEDRAALTHIQVGHRARLEAEVLEGLNPGDVVIEHPSDQIRTGTLVAPRQVPHAAITSK